MDDGLIFPYRCSTVHADVRVLTHAAVRRVLLGGLRVFPGGWWVVVWGPSVLVGKRINRGDAQW